MKNKTRKFISILAASILTLGLANLVSCKCQISLTTGTIIVIATLMAAGAVYSFTK